ncbi:MAG TPA: calcium-binding protein [Burkholderiales bacterium]
MTGDIQKWYDFVLQQMAAEAYLEGVNLADNNDIKPALQRGNNRPGFLEKSFTRFTDAQADEFLSKFQIIDQFSDNPTPTGSRPAQSGDAGYLVLNDQQILANTGLSATLIQKKGTNEYTLAIRSTEFRTASDGGDRSRDVFGADVNGLVQSGFALAQLSALEDYYSFLKQSGKLLPGSSLNVTGYSLGGHLATVFTEMHANDTDVALNSTYTFNSAGRGTWNGDANDPTAIVNYYRAVLADPNVAASLASILPPPDQRLQHYTSALAAQSTNQPFDPLSIYNDPRYQWAQDATSLEFGLGLLSPFDQGSTDLRNGAAGKISQLYGKEFPATATGVANSGVHGPAIGVFVEAQPLLEGIFGAAADFGNAHAIVLIADSLAVMRAYQMLDPNVTLETLNQIFSASSNKHAQSSVIGSGESAKAEDDALENGLDALRRLFLGSSVKPTDYKPGGSGFGDFNSRNGFYDNIAELVNSANFSASVGLARIVDLTTQSAVQLQTATQNSDALATRYALKNLNPFAVLGDGSIYAQHNRNGELDLFNPLGGTPAGMTSQYLTERAALLERKLYFNVTNGKPFNPVTSGGPFDISTLPYNDFKFYEDRTTGYKVLQGRQLNNPFLQHIIFGRDSDLTDTLIGGTQEDHLYGGTGNDFLFGNDEADYLEGGAGLDVYTYNASNTLFSSSNDGNDTIRDTNGKGVLRYVFRDGDGTQSTAIAGASFELSDTQWQSADGKYTYTKTPNDMGGTDLVVTINGDAGGSLTLKDYHDGDFGIRLSDALATPQTAFDIVGDFAPFDFDPNTPGIQTQTDGLGNLITDPSQPGPRDDTLNDSAGNDHIVSGGGKDVINDFRGGNDFIETGAGQDIVSGGSGNDLVLGGAGADNLDGGAGNDQLYAETQVDLATAITQTGQTADSGQGDFIAAGSGDDIVVGSNASDALFGGAGNDILVGGAGDDYLAGDTDFLVTNLDWTRVRMVQGNVIVNSFAQNTGFDRTDPNGGGDDVIYGGDGNDDILGEAGNDFLSGDAGNDFIQGGSGDDVILGGTGDDVLEGDDPLLPLSQNGDDYLDGGDGNDTIFSGAGNDILIGGAGDDIISGGEGSDTLYGGPGSDTLVGGPGKDTYVFNRGDGTDFIFDTPTGPVDPEASVLVLGPGISASDIKFRTGSLEIDLGGGDAIHFEDFNPNNPLAKPVLDSIQFADGTQLSYQDVLDRGFDIGGTENDDFIEGTVVTDRIDAKTGNDTVIGKAGDDNILGGAGNDILQGDAGNDTLEGDDGNDSLVGGFGDDVLRGGEGNDELLGEDGNDVLEGGNDDDHLVGGSGGDVLNGGAGTDILAGNDGSDTYIFAPGDGKDTVDEQGLLAVNFADTVSTDVIRFAEGVSHSDVALLRVSNGDLLIRYGQGDEITVKGQYAAPGNAIERIEFADGTVINKAALDAISIAPIVGTAGNDVLEGTEGDDTLLGLDGGDVLDGGSGNDRIEGGAGADMYLFYRGMGSDTLVDAAPVPEEMSALKLEAGLTLDSIKTQRRQGDLFVGLRGTSDGVLINSYYDANTPTQHWQVALADDTVTPLEDVISRPDPLADVVALSALQDYKQGILSTWNAESQAAILPTYAFVHSSWSQTVSTTFIQPNHPSFVQVFPQITRVDLLDYGLRRFNAFTPVSTFQHSVVPTFVNQESDAEVIQTIGTPSSITNTESHTVSLLGLVYGGGVVNVTTFSTNANTTNTIFSSTGDRWTPVRLDSGGPTNGVLNIRHSTDYRVLEEITAGDSANTIYGASGGDHIALIDAGGGDDIVNAGQDDFVYGNDGNDQVYSGNIVYGGNGDDYLSGGIALYGGAGNDTLTGGAFMAGGAGDDSLSGQYGANVFFIDPNEAGHDSVGDSGGTDRTALNYAYYRSVGVTDPGESERFGGRWGVVGQTGERLASKLHFQNDGSYQSLGEPDHFYRDSNGYGSDFFSFVYRTQDDLRAEFNNLGLQYQAEDIRYIQPLPPALEVKATDYAVLEPFVASGVIEADAVKFGDGLSPNDVAVKVDPSGDFLNFSWGQDHGLQVALAADEDPIGTGIERYAFSDGTVWTTAQAVERATQATESDDVIFYTHSSDVGNGLGGNDQLYGNAGDDVLNGGAGDDILDGGAGNDMLDGGSGNDLLDGGEGADVLIGGTGNDTLTGGEGDDMLIGGAGNDTLNGGNGADIYVYNPGGGNDTISDTGGIDKQSFDDLYYNSIGIFDVEFRRENGGRYVNNDFDPNTSFATPEAGRDLELQQETATLAQYQFFLDHPEAVDDPQQNIFGLTLQEFQDLVTQQQQQIDDLNANYLQRFVLVEPLPPAPDMKATDYAALESFIASGIIEADTVQFSDGLSPNDVTVRLDPSGNFLNFSWDLNDSVQVALPSDTDLIGTGIERYQFAPSPGSGQAGTVWSTAEAISRATQGTAGNDVLFGSAGNDVLNGGAGNDTLIGVAGDDTYIFNPGDGVDHIQDSSGTNAIAFGAGITPDSISLGLGSLLLHVGPSTSSGQAGDEIHIDDFDSNDVFANPSISNFQFDPSPGSGQAPLVLSYSDLIAKGFDLTGTSGDDIINGTNVNDRINGLGGNDSLNGGAGNNTYLFDPGFGHDVVVNPSNQGSIQFTNGIAPGDIAVSRDGLDLLFTDQSGNQVRVSNWYADANSTPIQQATFTDGTVWDAATLDGKTAVVNDARGLILIGSNGNDILTGGAWNDVLLGGKGKDTLYGGAGDDLLNGGTGNDVMNGDEGNDILEGGNGKDTLNDEFGNNLLNGGKGNDSLTGGSGNEFFIGGKGNDSITTGLGQDIIAFNRGDGHDTLNPSSGKDNSLSLGGGIGYQDLAFSKHSKNLIVEVGNGEKITLKEWYAAPENKSVLNLQVITDATTDYDPNSSNPLLNKRVNDFDFTALVDKYDQARKANKNLDHWSMMNSLLDAHLAESDTEALGGDLAYQYGKNSTLAGMGLGAAQEVLNSPQFGTQPQTLRSLATLQEGNIKLS